MDISFVQKSVVSETKLEITLKTICNQSKLWPSKTFISDENSKFTHISQRDSNTTKQFQIESKTQFGSIEINDSLINRSSGLKEMSNEGGGQSQTQFQDLIFEDDVEQKRFSFGDSYQQQKSNLEMGIEVDEGEEQEQEDGDDSSQDSLVHNVWHNCDDDLIARGIDIESWLDKNGNPFNVFNLYKARSGQFKTFRENLTNYTVCKSINRIYNSYSKQRNMSETSQDNNNNNNNNNNNTSKKECKPAQNQIQNTTTTFQQSKNKQPISFKDYLQMNNFKDSIDYTKSGYNHIIFDRFKNYFASYRQTQQHKYNFSPIRMKKFHAKSQSLLSENLAVETTTPFEENLRQTNYIRKKTKKLTVDIFDTPESKPTKGKLEINDKSFKLNQIVSQQHQKCHSVNDLDCKQEQQERTIIQDNRKINYNFKKVNIQKQENLQPLKSNNILPLQQAAALENQNLINKISQNYNLNQQIKKNSIRNKILDVSKDVQLPQNAQTVNKTSYFDDLPLSTIKSKLQSMQKLVSQQKNKLVLSNQPTHFEEILAPLKDELQAYQIKKQQNEITPNFIKKSNLFQPQKQVLSKEEILGQQENTLQQEKLQKKQQEQMKNKSSKSETIINQLLINNRNELKDNKNNFQENSQKGIIQDISPDKKSLRLIKTITTPSKIKNTYSMNETEIQSLTQPIINRNKSQQEISQSTDQKSTTFTNLFHKMMNSEQKTPITPISPNKNFRVPRQDGFTNYYQSFLKKQVPNIQERSVDEKQILSKESPSQMINTSNHLVNNSMQKNIVNDHSPLFFLNRNRTPINNNNTSISTNSQSFRLFQIKHKGFSQGEQQFAKIDESDPTINQQGTQQIKQDNSNSKAILNHQINQYYIPLKTESNRQVGGGWETSKHLISHQNISNKLLSSTTMRTNKINCSPSNLQRSIDNQDCNNSSKILNSSKPIIFRTPSWDGREKQQTQQSPSQMQQLENIIQNNSHVQQNQRMEQYTNMERQENVPNSIQQKSDQSPLSPLKQRIFKYEQLNNSLVKPFINSLFQNTKNDDNLNNISSSTTNKNNQTYYFQNPKIGQQNQSNFLINLKSTNNTVIKNSFSDKNNAAKISITQNIKQEYSPTKIQSSHQEQKRNIQINQQYIQ